MACAFLPSIEKIPRKTGGEKKEKEKDEDEAKKLTSTRRSVTPPSTWMLRKPLEVRVFL
jgi:hypothetical protein